MKALLLVVMAMLVGCTSYTPVKYYYLDMQD
jgi:uncharacterized lipoprotein YmbA